MDKSTVALRESSGCVRRGPVRSKILIDPHAEKGQYLLKRGEFDEDVSNLETVRDIMQEHLSFPTTNRPLTVKGFEQYTLTGADIMVVAILYRAPGPPASLRLVE